MKVMPRGGAAGLFPIAVMLALAMLTLWLARTIGLSGPGLPPEPSRDPDYIVEGLAVTRLSESGQPRYVLTSERMIHLPIDDTSLLSRPVLLQAAPGKPTLRIRADRGVLTAGGETAHLHDNVEVLQSGRRGKDGGATSDPIRITTSYLRVLPDDDRADTTAAVRVEQAGSVLHGTGMAFDNRLRRFQLHSAVRATYARGANAETR
ncbi:MAG: LPS export ABC transporter periplasmic protein LptC [Burkholderiales bacterium]|nr:LPS export ABC transporter periplasmic protein LptC [Burkholderiales bacterium]